MSDILVIGGGIAGVSAAARLAPHGRVTLLEAEDHLAYHASGRSAALFIESYGNRIVRALNSASANYLHEAHGGVLRPKDLLLVGKPVDEAAFRHDAAELDMRDMSISEAIARVPVLNPATCGFAAIRPAFDLDTDLFLQNFRREALSHGAEIVTGARVDSLRHEGGQWQANTAKGVFSAAVVINAAGAWADEVATLAGVASLGLKPLRRSMARIPAPGGQDTHGWPFLLGAGDAWYAKPDAGELIVSPCEEDPATPHDAWADDMVLAEGLARYEEMVTTPVSRMLANWAGLRTFAPDRALVIGAAPDAPGFFWLAGQGGYGFQTAAAASDLIADLVQGRTPGLDAEVVAALNPARFG